MKKIVVLMAMMLPLWSFAQTTLATWNFPNDPDDAVADGGIPANAGMTIGTMGGTNVITYAQAGTTTNCASVQGWANGNGSKYWQVKVVTLGYGNIQLSSKQNSSGTGPRDFKVQYSTDYAATWNDFAGNAVTVASNWTTGVLSNVALPSACDNKDTVYLRWIMTSDSAVNVGALVGSTGSSKMDDLYIAGQSLTMNPAFKLFIASVNGGTDPYVNAPFDVVVNSVDSLGMPANVATTTQVQLSLVTGSGALGGTLSGTINSGSDHVTISGITYDVAETGLSLLATDQASLLLPDTSDLFDVLAVIVSGCDSLLTEEFTDGDFVLNPTWTGDTAKFTVDASPQQWLQLDDLGVAASAYLTTGNNIPVSYDTITWEFLARIDYNTSSLNNARFYLMSDSANLAGPLTGYYVQLGGTNDSVSLILQEPAGSTVLMKDQYVFTGNASNLFRVKVIWTAANNAWTLCSDATGGMNWDTSGTAAGNAVLPSAYFPYMGVSCKYTSTTGNKYFFDDIRVEKCGECFLPPIIAADELQVNINAPLQLMAVGVPGATYGWSGPNGFSSAQQNPLVSNAADFSMTGMYYVTVTLAGCGSTTDSIYVTVLNQYCDDFSDGDFTSNFAWSDLGSNTNFTITPSFVLQSNGPNSNGNTVADDIVLVTPSPFSTSDSLEWTFLINLGFAPTADNWVRVYLMSNQQDITGSVNGYYIQIGETNADSIKFYRVDGGTPTHLFTGNTSWSGNVNVRVRIFKDCITQAWIVQADPTGGYNFADEGPGFWDNTHNSTSYFGILCHYKTDSRYNLYNFDDFCFQKSCLAGIEDMAEDNEFSVYPNPAHDKLTIETNSSAGKSDIISIYNLQGQLMWQQTLENNKTEICLSQFAKGIYFIKLNRNGGTGAVQKFIKY